MTQKVCLCQLRHFLREFVLLDNDEQTIYDRFLKQICMGLTKEGHELADTKCYMTYVQDFPTGDEQGYFVALDLGGTKFRVLSVHLRGKREPEMHSQIFTLSEEVITSNAVRLFDHVAKYLAEFLEANNIDNQHIALGFTFSFACQQTSLKRAILMNWSKGFTADGVVGEDVCYKLAEAIDRRGNLRVKVVAIVNDTTGTLMSCAYRTRDCRIGLIIGTGTNACYAERTANCERLQEECKYKPYILVNTEWAAFGEHGDLDFIMTDADRYVDDISSNRHLHIFEKMTSGKYLGTVVNYIMRETIQEKLMFAGNPTMAERVLELLNADPDCIMAEHLSTVEADEGKFLPETQKVLNGIFGIESVDVADLHKFRLICETISKRSAYLMGICLSVLINKMALPTVSVGVDGSVYRCHPKYPDYMREAMDRFVEYPLKYNLVVAEDGSGQGAAVIAAVADATA